ncbi:MAG TPA: tetratricopeptide repeat protein [Acidobacteriota bacterium]|nr:tetratricopeptide repeat protein [Acidobacteriota bacterium]
MSPDDVTLNPVADAIKWLNRHLPRWAKVALPVVIAAGLVWWYWEHVNRLPGVSQIVEWLETQPLPDADPDRFAVAIANLENDSLGEHRELIADALQDLEGVQILRFDRYITVTGGDLEEVAQRGHERARSLLEQAGADVLIWGRVLTSEGQRASRLYWTTSGGHERRAENLCQPQEFELPAIFWEELRDVLRLLVVTAGDLYIDQTGQFIADWLVPFTNQVRSLLKGADATHGWDSESYARVSGILANSLSILGEQSGHDEPLNEAVGLYREILKVWTRERVPLQWAATQNNLGNALQTLGERESGTDRLEEAVTAYKEALEEYTRERVPLDWAMTQNNLGNALRSLGEREPGTARLEEAVTAFKQALKERTRERVPLQWATTQNNLGNTLRTIGQRTDVLANVCDALGAHLAAWAVFTGSAPAYTQIAAGNIARDLALLKEKFPRSEVDACLKKHETLLQQFFAAHPQPTPDDDT